MIKRKILTENPFEEVWSYLSYFENLYNCKKFLIKNHNISDKKLLEKRALNLRYYIKQAREYFETSLRASFLTQPVLLYYGAVCLSEALILAKRGYEDTTKGHGLEASKLNNELTHLNEFKIKVVNKGTFGELSKTIKSGYDSDFNDLKLTEWDLNELFSMIPEIAEIFEENFNKKSQIIKVNRIFDGDGEHLKINEILFPSMTVDSINSLFSNICGLTNVYLPPRQINDREYVIFKKSGKTEDITKKTIMNEEYLISDIDKGSCYHLNEISIHFMILYSLSMLCRYYSYVWGEGSLELEKGDFFIVKNFLKISTRKFPNLILNRIMDTEFLFTPESYEPTDLRIDYHKPAIEEIVKDILKQEEKNKRLKEMIKSAKFDKRRFGDWERFEEK